MIGIVSWIIFFNCTQLDHSEELISFDGHYLIFWTHITTNTIYTYVYIYIYILIYLVFEVNYILLNPMVSALECCKIQGII